MRGFVNTVRCREQKIEQDQSETDKTQAKTKNNQKNAVDRGRTWCVEVDVRGSRPKNAVEHSLSKIEAIRGLMRSWE